MTNGWYRLYDNGAWECVPVKVEHEVIRYFSNDSWHYDGKNRIWGDKIEMPEPLKICAHCGGSPMIANTANSNYIVRCLKCYISIFTIVGVSLEEIIKRWNKRI